MKEALELFKSIPWWTWPIVCLLAIAIRDRFFNRHHTITRNFPVIGHFRYMFEKIGPEIRQYFIANNREELPFNRSQRSWIYTSSKKENNYQGFGTDQDQHEPNFIFIKPAMFPYKIDGEHPNSKDPYFLPCAKVIGPQRAKPFRPYSVINVSAMSFGSLSAAAINALNEGSKMAGNYHNTGEGGLSPYHSKGADVCFHFGTGYFGVRNKEDGTFSMDKMKALTADNPFVKTIELKLSQGAKPGKGGVLPAKKITKEIAEIRGVEMNKDVLSPANHSAFDSIPSMVQFIEDIANETGLPVGIKSAVGKLEMWEELADEMIRTGNGPDFITIDGGEGGTGAAPPAFADHVALPWVYAFASVYRLFSQKGLADKIVWKGSGKLGLPARAIMAYAMGVDVINVGREAMLSIGCIQAQLCHTNHCPSGVATQKSWYQSGIDVTLKSERFGNYVKTLRKEMAELTRACGYEHPCQITMEDIDIGMGDNNYTKSLRENYNYEKEAVPFTGMQALKDCEYLGG